MVRWKALKIIDKFWLAFHNIISYKTKSLLIFIIVFINSLALMFLLIIGFNVYTNVDNVLKNTFTEEYTINITNLSKEGYNIIHQDERFIVYEGCYYSRGTAIRFSYNRLSGDDSIVEGGPISTYSKTNSIIIPITSKNEEKRIIIGSTYKFNDKDFIIIGFCKSPNFYVDFDYIINNLTTFGSYSIHIKYDSNYSFDEYVNYSNIIKKGLNNGEIKSQQFVIDQNIENFITTSNNKIIFLLVVIISVALLLLLSMGNISNGISMSNDKNKHSYGIMLAYGMSRKDMLIISFIEELIIIIISIVIAFISLIPFNSLIKTISIDLIKILITFENYETIKVTFPIYIPLIFAIMFILYIVLFLFISYKKQRNINPIEMIKSK